MGLAATAKTGDSATRLREQVEKLTPGFDASDEDRAKAQEAIANLLGERLDASRSPAELETICELASDYLVTGEYGKPLTIPAARKAVTIAPQRPAANMCLAMALWQQAQDEIARERNAHFASKTSSADTSWYDAPVKKTQKVFLEAEKHARLAIQNTQNPKWVDYANLAQIQEEIEGRDRDAYANNRRALAVAKRGDSQSEIVVTLRNLWPQALTLGEKEQAKEYFAQFAAVRSNESDWFVYAMRMASEKEFEEAGKAYSRAAELASAERKASNFASAAEEYWFGSNEDAALQAARNALAAASPSESATIATANRVLGEVLLDRGVYDEALKHAEVAATANEQNFFTQLLLARALNRMHRNSEALSAAKMALRLSEGKYAFVHFTVGSIYFDMAQWADAEDAFKHAAALDKTDAAAAFNVALSLQNQGYKSDGVDWLEETIRRDPKYPKRAELEARIKKLRSQ